MCSVDAGIDSTTGGKNPLCVQSSFSTCFPNPHPCSFVVEPDACSPDWAEVVIVKPPSKLAPLAEPETLSPAPPPKKVRREGIATNK